MIVRRLTFTVFCGAALAPTIAPQGAGRHTSLRIGLVTAGSANPPSGAASVARGVRLGAAESKQTAALFGDDVDLYEADGAGGAALVAAEQLSSARKIQVLVGASAADADALSSFAESHHILFVNASSRAHSLRAACRRYAFHVEATDTMYANVARVGQELGAPVSAGASERSDGAGRDSVSLWGPTLERFGASQLNDRYRDKYQAGMDGSAWAGWIAVKIVAEAALRTRSTSPAKLRAYLESPTTQFDGHKGWPLTFRATDHQLRQPMYIAVRVGGGAHRFRDVPELRGDSSANTGSDAGTRATDRVLDRLIEASGERGCGWR